MPVQLKGSIVVFSDFNHRFSFFVERETDLIQNHHARGILYEREELQIIQRHGIGCSAFLDIGSNVGNHAIFIAKVLTAKVFAFEANPYTARLLNTNVALNQLDDQIDTSFVGMGLGAQADVLKVGYPFVDNLGAARLTETGRSHDHIDYPTAVVSVVPLDALNIRYRGRIGFIKLDVEGMEIGVLKGAAKFIADYRPTIFVEVDNENLAEFNQWSNEFQYVIVDRYKRYANNENFLITPS